MLTFALFFTAIALRMRLGFVVFLPRRLCLRLRLRRTGFRRARLGLRLRRAHLNVRLRCGTRGFHVRFRPALFRLGACAHLRRLVARALLHGRRRIAGEAIRLLATALRLRLRRLRARLRQLRTRLESPALVTRCTGRAFALRRARRHAGWALRRLHSLRLPWALLRRGRTRQRAWTIDRTRGHQALRSRSGLGAMGRLCTLRVRGAHQPLRTIRAALFRRSARLATCVCGRIGRGARQT